LKPAQWNESGRAAFPCRLDNVPDATGSVQQQENTPAQLVRSIAGQSEPHTIVGVAVTTTVFGTIIYKASNMGHNKPASA